VGDNYLPYVVKLLNNRIKKCRGCGSLFSRKADGSVLDPPNDLVVAREERRPFSDSNNVTRLSRLQNVYYHSNVACIRRQNASFVGPEIQVSAEITLLDAHNKYLAEHFGSNQVYHCFNFLFCICIAALCLLHCYVIAGDDHLPYQVIAGDDHLPYQVYCW
jgi:hypothetical protein